MSDHKNDLEQFDEEQFEFEHENDYGSDKPVTHDEPIEYQSEDDDKEVSIDLDEEEFEDNDAPQKENRKIKPRVIVAGIGILIILGIMGKVALVAFYPDTDNNDTAFASGAHDNTPAVKTLAPSVAPAITQPESSHLPSEPEQAISSEDLDGSDGFNLNRDEIEQLMSAVTKQIDDTHSALESIKKRLWDLESANQKVNMDEILQRLTSVEQALKGAPKKEKQIKNNKVTKAKSVSKPKQVKRYMPDWAVSAIYGSRALVRKGAETRILNVGDIFFEATVNRIDIKRRAVVTSKGDIL